MTGGIATTADMKDVDHWVKQVVSPVLFSAALEVALESMVPVVLEVGPNPILTRMAKSWIKPQRPLVWLASLDRQAGMEDAAAVKRAGRSLEEYQQRMNTDDNDVGRVFPNRRSFPWQTPPHPLLQQSLNLGDRGVEHKAVFHASMVALFNDYTIQGQTLFPGAGFVEMALAAAAAKLRRPGRIQQEDVELQDVSFLEPLDVEIGTALVCEVGNGGSMQFRPAQESRVVCTVDQALAAKAVGLKDDLLEAAKARCVEEVDGIADRYTALEEHGFHGPQFQTLVQVWRGQGEFVARLRLPSREENDRYYIHPAVLDGLFQLVGFVDGATKAWVPALIRRLQLRLQSSACAPDDDGCIWASGRVAEANDRFRVMDLSVFDMATGAVALSVEGLRSMPLKAQPPASGLYEVRWVEAPMAVDASTPDEAPQVSLLALPGCGNLCALESLSTAGLPSVMVDTSGEMSTTAEQWAAMGTLVVSVQGATDTVAMLTQLVDLLQVSNNKCSG